MPPSFPRRAWTISRELARFAVSRGFWPGLLLRPKADASEPVLFYGQGRLPGLDNVVGGGMVKLVHMQRAFPHNALHCNLVYLVSSALPLDLPLLLAWKRHKGIPLVVNQNGVGYPAWCGPNCARVNRPLRAALRDAAYVFYQSQFCKAGADRFLGSRQGSWEVLHNPVDTHFFTPPETPRPPSPLTLLLGGSQYQRYRLETALRATAAIARSRDDVRLLVTGRICWDRDEAAATAAAHKLRSDLGLEDKVDFIGPYSQRQAPEILRRAHVLLHTQCNDACPGLVLEAMACGLAIVYDESGGVPELVGEEAGIGVPTRSSYERIVPPDPEQLAEAVLRVVQDLPRHGAAAHRRAVEQFDIVAWLDRHRQVFMELLG